MELFSCQILHYENTWLVSLLAHNVDLIDNFMTLNFLIVLWIENTSFWSFIINLRLFYYDLLVASSFYCSLLWFSCECEPRSAGWSVFSCCSCLLFYRLTHGSCDGPHLRVAPICSENYLKHHETAPVSCLTLHSIGPCPLYCPPPSPRPRGWGRDEGRFCSLWLYGGRHVDIFRNIENPCSNNLWR